jgi:hypothetical protein
VLAGLVRAVCRLHMQMILVGMALCATGIPISAQPPTFVVPDQAACLECRIELAGPVIISDADSAGWLTDAINLARGPDGRFFVISQINRSSMIVLDAGGRRLKTVGRRGSGPGEYAMLIPPAFGPSDIIQAIDVVQMRRTLLNSSLEFIETRPLAMRPTGYELLQDGRMVASGVVPTPSRVGYPLHIIGHDGNITRSFGAASPSFRADLAHLSWRRIAVTDDERIWAAPVNSYRLELWDTAGALLETIEREAEWFDAWVAPPAGSVAERPPAPSILHVWIHGNQMWVMARVADRDWTPLTGGRRGVESGNRLIETDELDSIYDTMVEVIDLDSRRLITSRRFGQAFFPVRGAARAVYAYAPTADDEPRFEVWTLDLVPRSGGSGLASMQCPIPGDTGG